MKIGIYGGSFNPVHFGHVNLARRAIARLALDRLLVVPAATSPFKTGEKAAPAFFNRLAFLKAAFAAVPKAEIDLREINRGGVSYSIDTVREITAENPGAELHFLIGEDSVAGLPHWKDYGELATLCRFDAFPRTSESSTAIRRLFEENGVIENPDARLAEVVRQGVIRKNGFCPCRLAREPRFFCPCDEFKAQLADAAFHGPCHCRLYEKP